MNVNAIKAFIRNNNISSDSDFSVLCCEIKLQFGVKNQIAEGINVS